MRDDLDFLYQRAMRSKDIPFMQKVAEFLVEAGWDIELNELIVRIDNFHEASVGVWGLLRNKFDFFVQDIPTSDWYRNRENGL